MGTITTNNYWSSNSQTWDAYSASGQWSQGVNNGYGSNAYGGSGSGTVNQMTGNETFNWSYAGRT